MQDSGNGQDQGAAHGLWYVGDGRIDLRASAVAPKAGDAVVRTLFSAVSRGTERLVFEGRVPESEWGRMRAPRQAGEFPGPVKYGYAAVGVVEAGPDDLLGRHVFCLNPHETRFSAPVAALHLLPAGLPSRRAVLAANMETSLNALWDGAPGSCDRIVVVGAGVIGLLTAALAAGLPGAAVTVVDVVESRRSLAESLGARFALPADAPRDADLVFHASATAEGLAVALGCAGQEASVIEMSWHGAGVSPIPLGGAFHARRLRLISSQVGEISASRRPRWSHDRRLAAALDLLARDERFDRLIDVEIPFARAPELLPERLLPGAEGLGIVLTYP